MIFKSHREVPSGRRIYNIVNKFNEVHCLSRVCGLGKKSLIDPNRSKIKTKCDF